MSANNPELTNFYKRIQGTGVSYNNPNSDKYLITHTFRCLISGASGGGKTNALLNLIDKLNCFERFYLFVKLMGNDPLYDEVLVPRLQIVEEKYNTPVLLEYSCDLDDLPDVSDNPEEGGIDSNYQNLVVFDDMLDESNKTLKKISAYFTKMRKKNCSLIFIGQDYFQTPKAIRRNCNIFIFTGITSEKDLRQIHQDLARELDFEEFRKMFREATTNHSILIIDPSESKAKYRKNFVQVWHQ